MKTRILLAKTGRSYKVPEEMVPQVAQAMVDGGTAEWKLEVEASALSKVASNAAKFFQGSPLRHLGSPIPSAKR